MIKFTSAFTQHQTRTKKTAGTSRLMGECFLLLGDFELHPIPQLTAHERFVGKVRPCQVRNLTQFTLAARHLVEFRTPLLAETSVRRCLDSNPPIRLKCKP